MPTDQVDWAMAARSTAIIRLLAHPWKRSALATLRPLPSGSYDQPPFREAPVTHNMLVHGTTKASVIDEPSKLELMCRHRAEFVRYGAISVRITHSKAFRRHAIVKTDAHSSVLYALGHGLSGSGAKWRSLVGYAAGWADGELSSG